MGATEGTQSSLFAGWVGRKEPKELLRLSNFDATLVVELKGLDRHSANLRLANLSIVVPLKVLSPYIGSRIEKCHRCCA